MPRALPTDLYELMMAAGYHATGQPGLASFELSIRELPSTRGFLVAAGLDPALTLLEDAGFTAVDVAYLRSLPALQHVPEPFFDDFLLRFRFSGEVWAVAEGTPVFPHEPLLRVTAPVAEAQVVETMLLATVLFQTSVASRAARIVEAAGGRPVVEFGARRAHGLEAGVMAGRAAFLGGCSATSNVETGRRFGIPVTGTMAHSWVLSHRNEADAFRAYDSMYGADAVFVLDTYDTLEAARAVAASGLRPRAVRLDSGDLARLSRAVREILDGAGLRATSIFASGDLDEHKIAALVGVDAPIDAFGVGTALSTADDAPALSGVYKMVEVERDGQMQATFKRSPGKQTLGGGKQVWRVWSGRQADHDVLALRTEPPPRGASGLLELVMKAGERTGAHPSLAEVQKRCVAEVGRLSAGHRRLTGPDVYRVDVSRGLGQLTFGGDSPRRPQGGAA